VSPWTLGTERLDWETDGRGWSIQIQLVDLMDELEKMHVQYGFIFFISRSLKWYYTDFVVGLNS